LQGVRRFENSGNYQRTRRNIPEDLSRQQHGHKNGKFCVQFFGIRYTAEHRLSELIGTKEFRCIRLFE